MIKFFILSISKFASRTRNSLRNIPSPRLGEHKFAQLKIYYEEKGLTVNDSFLRNLDLLTPNGEIYYIGYLLADENSVSFKVAKFAGTNKNELIENEGYGYCSILKATQKILDKLDIENKTFTSVSGAAQCQERKMIDSRALREALINAVVHNDYTREVSPVVEIYSDHLSIVSYVGLVDGLSEEDFFNGKIYPFHHKLQIKNEIFNLQRHHHLLADPPMTGFGTQFDNRHIAEIEPKARRPFPLGRLF